VVTRRQRLAQRRHALRPAHGERTRPGAGIIELVQALDDHRARIDTGARRLATRRAGALADFISEYGAQGLRAVGGRRSAERILVAQSPALDGHSLVEILAAQAQTS
jgi:LAO/AO transport system kinase